MADNQNRAQQFALNWINSLKRMQGNKTTVQGIFIQADGACREVGIRSADYK